MTHTWGVTLTIPDLGLAELIASPGLLGQVWPDATREVMMLFHVLRMAGPSLADVLGIGLVQLLAPPTTAPASQLSLTHKTAALSALARAETGDPVPTPHIRPTDVAWLEVTDVTVDGRSGLRMAG